jgi:hypothetical protein
MAGDGRGLLSDAFGLGGRRSATPQLHAIDEDFGGVNASATGDVFSSVWIK